MGRKRHDTATNDDGVQDSFLDIVANIVGILILLVIVVGIRAAMQPQLAEEPVAANEPVGLLSEAVIEERAAALKKEWSETERLFDKAVAATVEAEERDALRIELATYTAAVEAELEREKAKLDQGEAERLSVRSELAQADFEWQQLMLQKVGLASKEDDSEKLLNSPTPLVRKSAERNIHLRLHDNRLSVVPLEQLLKLVKERSGDAIRRDLNRLEGVARVGPVHGYILEYAIILASAQVGPLGVRPVDAMEVGEVLPLTEDVGEPVELALQEGTPLDQLLDRSNPRDTVVTLWAYTDSVVECRALQTAIRKRGFAIDLRPLQGDQQILLSSKGRETAAQ